MLRANAVNSFYIILSRTQPQTGYFLTLGKAGVEEWVRRQISPVHFEDHLLKFYHQAVTNSLLLEQVRAPDSKHLQTNIPTFYFKRTTVSINMYISRAPGRAGFVS